MTLPFIRMDLSTMCTPAVSEVSFDVDSLTHMLEGLLALAEVAALGSDA